MSARVEQWRDTVQRTVDAQASPVPVPFVLAIIEAESTGNPKAYRGEAKIADGSIGLMQILYNTAKSVGYVGPVGDAASLSGLFDPETNIRFGVAFLTSLWNQLGSAADVASAYNGGIRPNLGFGGVLNTDSPVTVCLERDAQGNCLKRHTVQPGEYGNAEYVNGVLSHYEQYAGAQSLPEVDITGDGTGAIEPALLFALAAAGVVVGLIALRGQ